jgi:hypothetical protein
MNSRNLIIVLAVVLALRRVGNLLRILPGRKAAALDPIEAWRYEYRSSYCRAGGKSADGTPTCLRLGVNPD